MSRWGVLAVRVQGKWTDLTITGKWWDRATHFLPLARCIAAWEPIPLMTCIFLVKAAGGPERRERD